MAGPGPESRPAGAESHRGASIELADWRRRIATLYAEVRDRAADDPAAAWDHWRAVREAMYREHPQSPVPAGDRPDFRARHWPYDPGLRFEVEVEADGALDVARRGGSPPAPAILPMSVGDELAFSRIGRVTIPFPAGSRTLDLFWMAGYAGGLFLPFRDATNGHETYGAGRYLLDGAKSADLGGDLAAGHLVLDFNFAFQPSCAFDPRWACPLAPPENRLDIRIEAGERLA
ncbi:MAG: DUF1684 domain-containing protein [Chloroflexota bacterium]|nr:MAG: DUF1684 domain-containing protein [Chloroflexota bacterium]